MRSAELVINLPVLESNIQLMLEGLGSTELIFVVKSNAYGHGLSPVVSRAAQAGVKHFAVAYLHEALQVRQAAPEASILVLGAVDPAETAIIQEHRISPMVVSLEHARAFSDAAGDQPLDVHIKIDTGMGRLGILHQDAEELLPELFTLPGLNPFGICSHFATVEPSRPELGEAQYQRFIKVVELAEKLKGDRLFRHISSSRALQFYEQWDLDAVRPGIMLYGYGSSDSGMRFRTRPFLQWKSYLSQVKSVPAGFPVGYYSAFTTDEPTDIGTVCVGYADGLLRSLSNRGFVLVGGKRCPIIGRVSMNWITVDLGAESGCRAGDEVMLLGEQGNDAIWADDIARWAGTIAYEILVAIRSDMPRTFLD